MREGDKKSIHIYLVKNKLASASKPSWLMNICSGVIKGLIIIFICINVLTPLKVISYC